MKKFSTLDRSIYITWVLLLFLGALSAALNVMNALTEPTYFQYRSLKHILFSSVTMYFLAYLSFALASAFRKRQPDTELLITTSKLGNLLSLFSLVTIVMVLFFKLEADRSLYYAIAGGFMIGVFGVFTRRQIKN